MGWLGALVISVVQYPTNQECKGQIPPNWWLMLGETDLRRASDEEDENGAHSCSPINALLSTGDFATFIIQVDSLQLSATTFQVKNK